MAQGDKPGYHTAWPLLAAYCSTPYGPMTDSGEAMILKSQDRKWPLANTYSFTMRTFN